MYARSILPASLCLLLSYLGVSSAADTGCDEMPGEQWPLQSEAGEPPEFVFRGERRPPETIRAQGGWLPWSIEKTTAKAYGLFNHEKDERFEEGRMDTVYISTTTSFDVAARYAHKNAERGADTFIYYIHSSPNMIDLNRALGNETKFWWQREFSAMGGIRWSQVVGWVHVNRTFFKQHSYDIPPCGHEDGDNRFFYERLKQDCSEGYYHASADYCEGRWKHWKASDWEPQLAGFIEHENEFVREGRKLWFRLTRPWSAALGRTTMEHAKEFMEKTKAATGWRGDFPLFSKHDLEDSCPTRVKCPLSRLAKAVSAGRDKMLDAADQICSAQTILFSAFMSSAWA